MKDAWFRIDSDKDRDDTDFDARADYLEESAIDIMAAWNIELRDNGRIDYLDIEDVDITAMAVEQNISFDAVLFQLAYKRAEEKLAESVKWG